METKDFLDQNKKNFDIYIYDYESETSEKYQSYKKFVDQITINLNERKELTDIPSEEYLIYYGMLALKYQNTVMIFVPKHFNKEVKDFLESYSDSNLSKVK